MSHHFICHCAAFGVFVLATPSLTTVEAEEPCLSDADCPSYQYCLHHEGACTDPGVCMDRLDELIQCLAVWEPVCGCDRRTYSNGCCAHRAAMSIDYAGECADDRHIPWSNEGCPSAPFCVHSGDCDTLAACLAGPGWFVLPDCILADADGDADVDLIDAQLFQANFRSANAGQSDRPRNTYPDVHPDELAELVAGNTAFAFDLYQAMRDTGENIFYSPHSISLALAMTYAGARNATETQMAQTLHFTLRQERLHAAFNALDLELARRGEGAAGQDGEGFSLNIVNATWGQVGYTFVLDYLDILAEQYGAGIRLLDFCSTPEPCRVIINDWVEDQTEGRIENLIPQDVVTPLTRLVLTNAIYFNAAWEYPFDEEDSHDALFMLLDGSLITVPMMSQTQVFGYTQGAGYQALELPYDGYELSMVILLPDPGTFEEFERLLDGQRLSFVLEELQYNNVALTMPKFTYASGLNLKETLANLGMPYAFVAGFADFSGMDGTRDLYISDVFHSGFVSVDEAGTEAAAATAVVVGLTSVPPPPIEVIVDRPFIFVIRDIATEAVLFVGRMQDPRE